MTILNPFIIKTKEPLQDGEHIEARDNGVFQFLKGYKPGDLTKSANIHVSEKAMKIGLENNLAKSPESAYIADFMESMPDFGAKTKRIGKFF